MEEDILGNLTFVTCYWLLICWLHMNFKLYLVLSLSFLPQYISVFIYCQQQKNLESLTQHLVQTQLLLYNPTYIHFFTPNKLFFSLSPRLFHLCLQTPHPRRLLLCILSIKISATFMLDLTKFKNVSLFFFHTRRCLFPLCSCSINCLGHTYYTWHAWLR